MFAKYIRLCKRIIMGGMVRIAEMINPQLATRLCFFRLYKRLPDYKNPKLYAEKIIARMRSKEFEQLEKYADKWKVRDYVDKMIGKEYLLPVLEVYDTPEDVCYEKIQEGSYVKLNHGCGYNIIYTKATKARVKRKIKRWFREDFSQRRGERQYKNIKRKILIEENIAPNGEQLFDYGFFTFHGKVEFTQIRDNRGHRFEVGREYEKLPFRLDFALTPILPQNPRYEEMVKLAEKLATPFDFVRVDFFCVEDKIYFGELTFSPRAGIQRFTPYEYNLSLGEKVSQSLKLL